MRFILFLRAIPRTEGKKREEKGFAEKKKWVSKIDDRLYEKDILS